MTRQLHVSIPEYLALPEDMRPDTYEDIVALVHRPAGIWQILVCDAATGDVIEERISGNCISDDGVSSLFKNTFNATSAGIGVANIIAIDAGLGIATVGAISSGGTVTAISVTALTGTTIPSGTTLLVNPPGTTNKLLVSTTAAITGAGSCSVVSTPGPVASIAAGSFARYATASDVVGTALTPMPTTGVAALTAPISYTAAMPSGQFNFATARQVVITNDTNYLFNSVTANGNPSLATNGTYTAAWLVNGTVTSTANTFVHIPFDSPLSVSATFVIKVIITEKL
jgi:hypothetical protein